MTHVLLDELDINWTATSDELELFRDFWDRGLNGLEIANRMGRTSTEVALLIIDQAERGEIEIRRRGFFGEVATE